MNPMPDEKTESVPIEYRIAEKIHSAIAGWIETDTRWHPTDIYQIMRNEGATLEKQNAELRAALEEERNLKGVAHDIMMHERLRGDDLERALEGLTKRLRVIHDDPEYLSVWVCAQNHQGYYRGPTYVDELEAAEAALRGKERA